MKHQISIIVFFILFSVMASHGQQNVYGEDFTPNPFGSIANTDFPVFAGDCQSSASHWVTQTMATNCGFPGITQVNPPIGPPTLPDPDTELIATYNNIEFHGSNSNIPRTVYERSIVGACPGVYQLNLRAIPKPYEGPLTDPSPVKLFFETVYFGGSTFYWGEIDLSWTSGWLYYNLDFLIEPNTQSIRIYQPTNNYIEDFHDFAFDFVNICPIDIEHENTFTLESSGNWVDYCYPSVITLVPDVCGDEMYRYTIKERDPVTNQTIRFLNSGFLEGETPNINLNDAWNAKFPNEPFKPCMTYEVDLALHALGEAGDDIVSCSGWNPVGMQEFSFRGFQEEPDFEIFYSVNECVACIDVEELVYCDLDNIELEFTIDGVLQSQYNDQTNFCHEFPGDGEYEICMETTGLVGNLIGVHCDVREVCKTITINNCACQCEIMALQIDTPQIDGCLICIDPLEALPANDCTTITSYNWNFNDEANYSTQTDEEICHVFQSNGLKTITLQVDAINNLTNEPCSAEISIEEEFEICGGPVCCELPTPTLATYYFGNCELGVYANYQPNDAQCADQIWHTFTVDGQPYTFDEQGPHIIDLYLNGEIELCLTLQAYDAVNEEFCFSEEVCKTIVIEDNCNPVCCSIENPGFTYTIDAENPCTIIVDPGDELIIGCEELSQYRYLWTFGEDDQEVTSYTSDPISYTYSGSGVYEVCMRVRGRDLVHNEHCYSEEICQTVIIDNCLGFRENDELMVTEIIEDEAFEVYLYPNPATNIIHIDSSSDSESLSIKIHNLSGQLLLNQKHLSPQASIDVSELEKGVYIVEVTEETGKRQSKKLIIQ